MATTWIIDKAHSEIEFKIKHLMISTVTGNFRSFDLSVETVGEDFTSASKVQFNLDAASVETKNEQRDNHLKSADFFDAEKYPKILFESDAYQHHEGQISGQLTIKGITKPCTFDVDFGGIAVDPYGQTKAGFTISGKINRKDFGLTWDAVTEAGTIVVSNEIRLNAEIQLIKQA